MTLSDKITSIRDSVGIEYSKPTVEKMNQFVEYLGESSIAQDYLLVKRGLANETIKNFNLGYDKERNAIAIPVYKRGELINIRYRLIEPKGDTKYTQERGCEVWLYNEEGISKGLKKGGVLITEGEFDCMSAWQAGFKNVVSPSSGKDSFGIWLELLDNVPKVYIAYDNDKGGKSSAIKMAERIGIEKCMEVSYPEGIKDTNEYFSNFNSTDFRTLLKNARPFYKYKFSNVGDVLTALREFKGDVLTSKFLPFIEMEDDWVVVISARTNVGKCHGKGTEILMYNGEIKKVEDIKVGDFVMGVNSQPRKVLSLGRGKEEMYKVWQRGEAYTVNKSHILSLDEVKSISSGHNYISTKHEKINISVEDFLQKSENGKRKCRGWKTFVNWKKREVALDPYILGLWLGDGSSSKPQIVTADKEIVESIDDYVVKNKLQLLKTEQKNNKSSVYSISSFSKKQGTNLLRKALKKYNLFNNKHIPQDYKINDRKTRLELLAGLMDTDGYLAKTEWSECMEIIQKNEKLSHDIVFLVRSLGFRVKITKCKKEIKSRNFIGNYYRMTIVGNLGQIPIRLKRKQSNFIPRKKFLTSSIEIRPIGIDDYYGFTLDGDGLYLLSDFTVTHNTAMVLNIANELADKNIPTLILPFERGVKSVGKRFLQIRFDKTKQDFEYLENKDWDDMSRDLVNLPTYFSVPTPSEIQNIIKQSKRIFDTKVVIIDHFDLMIRKSGGKKNEEAERVLMELKQLAQEHGIIFLIVHHIRKQLNTAQKPKRPVLEDLKGVASLYQDPEAVVMLHTTKDDKLEVNIAKNKGTMGYKIFDFETETGIIKEIVKKVVKEEEKVVENQVSEEGKQEMDTLWETGLLKKS